MTCIINRINLKNLLLSVFGTIALSNATWAADTENPPEMKDVNIKEITQTWEKKIPYLKKPYRSAAPISLMDGIEVGKLGESGEDKNLILTFVKEVFNEPAAKERRDKCDSLLISYKGKLIFESYGRRGRVNVPHSQYGLTQIYTALALGRVIQLGYLKMTDLKSPCVKYLPQLDLKKLSKGVDSITIEEALTNHSGIRFDKRKKSNLRGQAFEGQARMQAYLECVRPIDPSSKEFHFQGFEAALIMQIIESIVPGSAEDFIQAEVLNKLGISKYVWEREPSGIPKSANGCSFRSRDMLKFGLLFTNQGKWQGEQLISQEFIQNALSPLAKAYGPYNYSYFIWQRGLSKDGKKANNIQLRGGKTSQLINIFPEHELIIVTTSHGNLQMIKDNTLRILPAFVK
jgi:hypothetical protein